jgi:hypothetical protein
VTRSVTTCSQSLKPMWMLSLPRIDTFCRSMTHNSLLPTVRGRHGKEKMFKKKRQFRLRVQNRLPFSVRKGKTKFRSQYYQLLFEISCIDIAQKTMNPAAPLSALAYTRTVPSSNLNPVLKSYKISKNTITRTQQISLSPRTRVLHSQMSSTMRFALLVGGCTVEHHS